MPSKAKEMLVLFHGKLTKMIPRDPRLNYIIDDLDDIITEVSGVKFKSCPFCHEMLFEGKNFTWVCHSIGNHGGQQLVFLEGSNPCKFIEKGGPFCKWNGYCLWQVHGPLGHPVLCKNGRIDDQSPSPNPV